MITRYGIPLLALIGLTFAIWVVMQGNRPVPAAEPVSLPAEAPYVSFVAGAGIVEPQTENIAIGTPLPGLVMEVFAQEGDTVKAGDPLFRLDDRNLRAELAVRQAAIQVSMEKLARLQSLPRPEDLPPAQARVKSSEMHLQDAREQLRLMESVTDKRAISEETLDRRKFAVRIAEANLQEAQAQLALLTAGSWKVDLEVAKADVESAKAQAAGIQTEIDRLTVRSPIDGQVLQGNVRVGEYAQTGALQTPLMILGDVEPLHVRTDVDEHDAWRIRPDAPAYANARGNREIKTALQFVRIEPYVVPKKSLTGQSTERVDTRVLQVLYRFDRGDLPIYVGQQMDVFIEAPAIEEATAVAPVPAELSMAEEE